MTKTPKFLFISLLQCFRIVHISHVLHERRVQIPFVLLFPANMTPSKNWGKGRDLHQCLPQRIANKDYMESKINRKHQSKHLLQIKKYFSIKKSNWNKNLSLVFYVLPNLQLVAKCNLKTSLSFSTLFFGVFSKSVHSVNCYSFSVTIRACIDAFLIFIMDHNL